MRFRVRWSAFYRDASLCLCLCRIALLGMMFYVVPMYWSGITQGLMWKQFTPEGFMQYPNFLETVLQLIPMYRLRAIESTIKERDYVALDTLNNLTQKSDAIMALREQTTRRYIQR